MITNTSNTINALFREITAVATIRNLTVAGNISMTSPNQSGTLVAAGIVGKVMRDITLSLDSPLHETTRAVIENCYSNVNITITSQVTLTVVGGIVAQGSQLHIQNCIVAGTWNLQVGQYSSVGGVIENLSSLLGVTSHTISDNINLSTIITNGTSNSVSARIAGIVGVATNTKIINNINYGFLKNTTLNTITETVTSGIVGGGGSTFLEIIISNNFNSGVLEGQQIIGCILGVPSSNQIMLNNHYDKQMCGEED